jgi:DDE superfamily endonuclease
LPERSVVLVEDETDLLLFPPLRAMWSPRGEPARVMLSGRNARRVVFGCMNLMTGHRVFLVREKQYAIDFQAFLREVRRRYDGRRVVMLLDADSSHTARASRTLARQLNIRLLWLPTRSPELNPMDTLWGQAKDAICVNTQYTGIDEQADAFIAHVSGLSNREALRTSGVLSKHFWLRRTLSSYFCGPA